MKSLLLLFAALLAACAPNSAPDSDGIFYRPDGHGGYEKWVQEPDGTKRPAKGGRFGY